MNDDVLRSIREPREFVYEVVVEERTCRICNARYMEKNNVGSWQCWQHPGRIAKGRWTCCGLTVSAFTNNEDSFYAALPGKRRHGCVRCDHRPTLAAYSPYDCVVMPKQKLFMFSGIVRTALQIVPERPPLIVIWRYDNDMQAALGLVMENHARACDGELPPAFCVTHSLCQQLPEIRAYHQLANAAES